MANIFSKQISNRNYMSPLGFDFTIARFPKVAFFAQTATLPELTLGGAKQETYLKEILHPGDRLQYGQLTVNFLVDEDMINYSIIHNWMVGLGFPESTKQFLEWTTDKNGDRDYGLQYSDGSLKILDSNYNTISQIKYWDLFPTSLSALEFTVTDTDVNYLQATVSFNFLYLQILDKVGNPLTPSPFE